ncbi:MAG: transporter substrate-binding domain-containing protein [Alphaproteobacteria bacterium]|nr:transporter substrate-binding domain-containing protein [Alphaproteobacteria bacterium]
MKKTKLLLTCCMIAGIAGFVLTAPIEAKAETEARKSAYERVIQSGVLKCGYISWPNFMEKDPNTGQFSGLDYDYTNAIAESLDLKVEWAMEVSAGLSVEALKTGKIDAICTAEGPLFPSTTKYLAYSEPIGYFPFFLYARQDDARFDHDISKANDVNIKIAVVDGDISTEIVKTFFPQATRHTMAQMASPAQMYMDVATNKADLFIDGPLSVETFMRENPNKIKMVKQQKPLAVIPNTFSVLRGEEGRDLVDMLNQAIKNLRNSGKEAQILAKYSHGKEISLLPVAPDYSDFK